MIKFAIVRTAIPTRVLRMIHPPSDVARHEPEETSLDEYRAANLGTLALCLDRQ